MGRGQRVWVLGFGFRVRTVSFRLGITKGFRFTGAERLRASG